MPAYKCACNMCDCKTTLHVTVDDMEREPRCMKCIAGECIVKEDKHENPS